MILHFCKSSFYRTPILLWLFVSLAGQMLDTPRTVAATAITWSAQTTPRAVGGKGSQGVVRGAQPTEEYPQIPLTEKQKRDLLKSNFEKMKRDAKELGDLAKALEEDLNKSNENVLSLDVVDKADKIEKLARRIKGTARGF